MKGHGLLCRMVLSMILVSGCSSGGDRERSTEPVKRTTDVAAGATVYNKYCFYCHGKEGRGDGAIGIGLPTRPVDFVGDVERMRTSDEALLQSISRGVHRPMGADSLQMPRWDLILKEHEIRDVLAYVRFLAEQGRAGREH